MGWSHIKLRLTRRATQRRNPTRSCQSTRRGRPPTLRCWTSRTVRTCGRSASSRSTRCALRLSFAAPFSAPCQPGVCVAADIACAVPQSAMPIILNVTIINGMGLTGKITVRPKGAATALTLGDVYLFPSVFRALLRSSDLPPAEWAYMGAQIGHLGGAHRPSLHVLAGPLARTRNRPAASFLRSLSAFFAALCFLSSLQGDLR